VALASVGAVDPDLGEAGFAAVAVEAKGEIVVFGEGDGREEDVVGLERELIAGSAGEAGADAGGGNHAADG
jgi:hypothetical protein